MKLQNFLFMALFSTLSTAAFAGEPILVCKNLSQISALQEVLKTYDEKALGLDELTLTPTVEKDGKQTIYSIQATLTDKNGNIIRVTKSALSSWNQFEMINISSFDMGGMIGLSFAVEGSKLYRISYCTDFHDADCHSVTLGEINCTDPR